MPENTWKNITPAVDHSAEFIEIVNDFGSSMELVREAISNAIDWKATYIKISFQAEHVDGLKRLIIRLKDNGSGMNEKVLSTSFWGLGYSESRKLKKSKGAGSNGLIGEKGHGTKIYLRSEEVRVQTKSSDGCFESVCVDPLKVLSNNKLHAPLMRRIDDFLPNQDSGTIIKIIGYNGNVRSEFTQDIVRDYIKWFTKVGSVEHVFGIKCHEDFKVYLKCVDVSEYEEVSFGHIFPKENSNINALVKEYEFDAADHYVKRFIRENVRLDDSPEVTFDLVISIEGDDAKKNYNPMLRKRKSKGKGTYKVSDRYGIWICKDYIPITRVNEWISGFGKGSNSLTMIHGFINCQELKLTANRGAISNTGPKILNELKDSIKKILGEIDSELSVKAKGIHGIYDLRERQRVQTTIKQEASDYKNRIDSIKKRKKYKHNGRLFLEPRNEAETFGFFMSVYSLYPEKFLFEPLDYDASRGIDLIARNKTDIKISESEFWYVELKFILKQYFNHAFKNLRWILCWDIDKKLSESSELVGVEDSDIRYLKIEKDEEGNPRYLLDRRARGGNRIEIIRLKEFIRIELGMEFK